MELTPLAERFILHWGEMGTRWGVNRTVAQIHAVLYLAQKPLSAEEIADTLVVARSNVSVSLRELASWGLVRMVHVLGDRRDHFETLKDVWQIFLRVMEERRRRELEPTLTMLRDAELDARSAQDPALPAMVQMLEFLELLTGWHDQMRDIPPSKLSTLMRVGKQIQHWMPG